MKKVNKSKFKPSQDYLSYSTQLSSIESWNNCEMGDWMLYTAKKLGADERRLSLAKGLCAETVIHLMGDERSKNAVRAAISYGKGEIGKKKLGSANAAAAAAASTAASFSFSASYAASASDAASDIEAPAYISAFVAIDVANAAAAYASDVDDAEAARKSSLKQTADICREILTGEIKRILGI